MCHSILNNVLDNSELIFKQIIDCLKVGGYAIFASKIRIDGQNLHENEIKELEKKGLWKFKTDYQFYKYDKVFGAAIGKFSTKKVLYLVYEKVDRNKWLLEQENIRLAEVAE